MLRQFLHDFHLHTVYSDGILQPQEVIERIAAQGIRHVAITDHETTRALAHLNIHDLPTGIIVHTGIELDCYIGSFEVHLLGLDFDPGAPALRTYIEEVHQIRRERYTRLLEAINRHLGEEFMTPENTFPTVDGTWMKPHVFRRLAEHKQFQQVDPVEQYPYFREWLKEHGLTVKVPRLSIPDAIEMIHQAAGFAILAHPGYYWKHGLDLPMVLRELKEMGLDGVEVFYPYFQARAEEFPTPREAFETVRAIYHLTRDLGLKITRGSDVHLPEHVEERYPQLQQLVSEVADFEIRASV